MGNIGFTKLRPFALTLKEKLNIKTFVETGTYKAQTTLWASDNFDKVYSIEAYEPLYKNAVNTNKDRQNITFLFGDSGTQLTNVLKEVNQSIIWLDAHWCGGVSKEDLGTNNECPIREELKAIKENNKNHLILIDDARLFTEIPPYPHDLKQWPRLPEIKSLLPNDYDILIWNDVLICVHNNLIPYIRNLTGELNMQVIVLTSNKYLHCLKPFSYLFNKFWNPNQSVKVVRYEIRPYGLPDNFKNFAIGKQDEYTWSSGLIKYLNYHNSDLVLLMLEDYFIDKPVNTKMVKWAWDYMSNNPNIGKIDLTDDRLKFSNVAIGNGLIKSTQDAPYLTSLQAAIWRKDFLLKFLDEKENAWEFEKRGTKRVKKLFDGLILGFENPPLSYVNGIGGMGNKPEEWDFRKIPAWMTEELKLKR